MEERPFRWKNGPLGPCSDAQMERALALVQHGRRSIDRKSSTSKRVPTRWSIYDLLKPAAESNCPKTVELLQRWFRGELGEPVTAQFSALRAGAHIPPHCGVSNVFLTAHLGLIVPQGCVIRVGNEKRSWSEGRGLVFDDSFEHEVWNESDSMRIVLIARFYHPVLTELEIEALGTLHERVRALLGENTAVQRELLGSLRRH